MPDTENVEILFVPKNVEDSIWSTAFSRDQDKILTGSTNGIFTYWDLSTKNVIFEVHAHDEKIRAIAISSDGSKAISCGDDNIMKLWDLSKGETIFTFRGDKKSIQRVTFSPDGMFAITGNLYGVIQLWDTSSGREFRRFGGYQSPFYDQGGAITAVAISPDSRTAATGGDSQDIKFWDMKTGNVIVHCPGHQQIVREIQFSPDGTKLVSASRDTKVGLWEVKTGKLLSFLKGHTDEVFCVTYSSDGQRIASGGTDGTIRIWDSNTYLQTNLAKVDDEYVTSIGFSSDGNSLFYLAREKSVNMWAVVTNSLNKLSKLETTQHNPPSNIVINHENSVELNAHKNGISKVWFSDDGRRFYSADNSINIVEWDWISGKIVNASSFKVASSGLSNTAFSHDMHYAMTSDVRNPLLVHVWNVQKEIEQYQLGDHCDTVLVLDTSPDSSIGFTGDLGGLFRLWDIKTGKCLRELTDTFAPITRSAFSSDGKKLIASSAMGHLTVWDVSSGQVLKELLGIQDQIFCLALNYDGKLAVNSSEDSIIRIWDVLTGKELHRFGSYEEIQSAVFTRDSEILAVGGEDGVIRLITLVNWKTTKTFSGHTGSVSSLSFSPSGNVLLSGDVDKKIRIWKL